MSWGYKGADANANSVEYPDLGLRMTKTASAPKIGAIERALLKISDGAFCAFYLVLIGFATLPAMSLLLGDAGSGWTVVPFLLSILLLLRIVPAVVRKLVPFSGAARDAWAVRRRAAKRYDSYQWGKLLWIGGGLAIYIAASGQFSPSRIVVCATCLLAGAAGMARWRAVSTDEKPALPAQKAQSAA
jgi:hypothetical protein